MKSILKYLIVTIILAFGFEFLSKELTLHSFHNLIENILFALIIVLIIVFLKNTRIKLLVTKGLLLLFSLSTLLESLYFYLFDTFFNTSAVFVILESNSAETKEFLISKMEAIPIIFAIIFLAITILMFTKLNFKNEVNHVINLTKVKAGFLIVGILVVLKVSALIIYNLPYLLLRTPSRYYEDTEKFKAYGKENPIGNFNNVEVDSSSNKKIYVIVIGESTNRTHFEIYNSYYRNTTPLLREIEDELFVFEDVISPHTYTIGALTKALTLGNYENPELLNKGSIIQLFNQTGFDTYWLSNQRPVGVMDTKVTKIAMGSKYFRFFNTKHTNEKTPLDIDLVNALKEVVKEDGDRKVIFLHMLGTHMDYKRRYPKSFEYFNDTPKTAFKSKKAFSVINSYDNSIKYNDFLVRAIIETVRNENVEGYVLYFSDHGQEVYNDKAFFGHTLDEQVTKNMYQIPYVLWLTEDYKKNNYLNFDVTKKYMTDDLIHSIADISHISSKEIDSTRSIFNKNYKERKRIIQDSIEYDILFKKQKSQ